MGSFSVLFGRAVSNRWGTYILGQPEKKRTGERFSAKTRKSTFRGPWVGCGLVGCAPGSQNPFFGAKAFGNYNKWRSHGDTREYY